MKKNIFIGLNDNYIVADNKMDSNEEIALEHIEECMECMDLSNELLMHKYYDIICVLNNVYDEAYKKGYEKGCKEGFINADEMINEFLNFYDTIDADTAQKLFPNLGIESIIRDYSLENIMNIIHEYKTKEEEMKKEHALKDASKIKPGCKIIDLDTNRVFITAEILYDSIDNSRKIHVFNPDINNGDTMLLVNPNSIKMIDEKTFFGKIVSL